MSETKYKAGIGVKTGKQWAAPVLRDWHRTLCNPLGNGHVDTVFLEDVVQGTRLIIFGQGVGYIVLRADPAQVGEGTVPILFLEAVDVDE